MPSSLPTRFAGLDLARFVALIGMFAAHLWLNDRASNDPLRAIAATTAFQLSEGTASTLFAVLGGMSLVLATRRVREERGARGVLIAVLVRGLIVMFIGTLLAEPPVVMVVVLVYFGAAMIVAGPFLLAPSWLIVLVGGLLALFGGGFNAALRVDLGIFLEGESLPLGDFADPVTALRALLLTGVYPVITWLVYLLLGILVARGMIVTAERGGLRGWGWIAAVGGGAFAALAIIVSSVTLAAVGAMAPNSGELQQAIIAQSGGSYGAMPTGTWWMQLIAAPHSGTPMDILRTGAVAVSVIGLMTALTADRRRLAYPVRLIATTGAAPLTIYVAHCLASIPIAMSMGPRGAGFELWAMNVAGALVIGAILLALRRKGPLEALIAVSVRGALLLVPRRRAVSPVAAATRR
ncbi:heparan-alpha-glucosaminide N-acetyltransferase domain-containing protein [Microbacterium nymphoidis]|uniref:heparan-alpha-glucosaminide N-acetyltransferase domain-containing protein n=1 Tax=Microbacterium nymphoidis TaxID=2898586 RepID=UPI001E4CAEC1|nr:heparan-alpha-glucosaminide N-acetyltransferase domain-containing protein [Microbacterium nymphoidis]MCD2497995.1 heparan-alpha-glucosaminide N-acetyltransferase domain-containing protein [Microbacterium nymphoidis]